MTLDTSSKAQFSSLPSVGAEVRCASCRAPSSEYYVLATADRPYLCGRCIDDLDNVALPYRTSEFAWQLRRRGMDD